RHRSGGAHLRLGRRSDVRRPEGAVARALDERLAESRRKVGRGGAQRDPCGAEAMTSRAGGLRRNVLAIVLALPVALSAQQRPVTAPDTSDDFRWLEEMHGARAMAWVRGENAKTQAVLERDPRFRGLFQEALTV